MTYKRLTALAVGIAACLFPRPARAADAWVEVRSPHFIVISDAGERAARSVAFDWEQLRVAIHSAWPWARVDVDRPVVVIAANNIDSMKAFAPQFWEERGSLHPSSVGTGGPDQHSFLLQADLSKEDYSRTRNPYFSAYWQYVEMILDTSVGRPLPAWLQDGLASVMANSIVGGSVLQIGHMMAPYVSTLHNGEHPTIPELVKIDRNSPWYTRGDHRVSYDAMAWAFTHYMRFGDDGAHREKFQQFLNLLIQGKNADEALAATLGDVSAFTAGFAVYLNRPTWPFSQLKADMAVAPAAYAARKLAPAESDAARARFHTEMGRVKDARASLDAAEKADPKSAAAYDVEGLLAEKERRLPDAILAFAKAMELGSTSFYTYYRWASMNVVASRSDAALRARVTASAERGAVLNKLNPQALSILATVTSLNGNKADAIAYAERAVELTPGNTAMQAVLDSVTR